MSDTIPQSVSNGCRKYVKSRIIINTFNTFNNVNQLHHYVEQLINDERYEEAAKVKLIIQKEEAAAHEIFGLNFYNLWQV